MKHASYFFFHKNISVKGQNSYGFQLIGPFNQVVGAKYTPCWVSGPPLKPQYLVKYTSQEKAKIGYVKTFIPMSHIHEHIAFFMFSIGFQGWSTDPAGCIFGPFNLVNWPHQLKTAAGLAFNINILWEKIGSMFHIYLSQVSINFF